MQYETKPVIEISYESLIISGISGGDSFNPNGANNDVGFLPLSDHGAQALEAESFQNRQSLIDVLTNRQKAVVELLSSGMTREQVADHLAPPVCVQAVHQIVLRIRKRLAQKAGVPLTGWRRTHASK
jgi:DNA-binding NarL/FixJ family response regulator